MAPNMGQAASPGLARVLGDAKTELSIVMALTGDAAVPDGAPLWAQLLAVPHALHLLPPHEVALVTRNACDRLGACTRDCRPFYLAAGSGRRGADTFPACAVQCETIPARATWPP